MTTIPLLSSTAANAEASQIIGTVNGVIQSINTNTLIGSTAPTSLRNIIIGGDFNTNPWQRGTSFAAQAFAAGSTNTTIYNADRFLVGGGASSSVAVSKQTASVPPGFGAKLRFQRTAANADVSALYMSYVVESNDVFQMQGLPFVLSFYAQAGANYSSASSVLSLQVASGTVADEGAGNGTGQFSTGGWTGFTAVQLTGSAGTVVTGVTLTTAWQRFAVAGVIPTAALEVGIKWSFTPVGTAGASDFFEIAGVQLEVMPQGGVSATPFERRTATMELQLAQRYCQVISEVAGASQSFVAAGFASTTSVGIVGLPVKVPFRVAPTVTYPAGTGGFVFQAAPTTLSSTLTLTQQATSTVNAVYAKGTSTITSLVAGGAISLIGTAGGSSIVMSAEL